MDDFECFLESAHAAVEWIAERLKFRFIPAGAQAEDQPAAADFVDRISHFGQQSRIGEVCAELAGGLRADVGRLHAAGRHGLHVARLCGPLSCDGCYGGPALRPVCSSTAPSSCKCSTAYSRTRSRSASASQRSRPSSSCCRQGPGSPTTSERIQPVLRCSSLSKANHIEDGKFHFIQQKTGAELRIPIHKNLVAILREYSRDVGPIVRRAAGLSRSMVSAKCFGMRLARPAFPWNASHTGLEKWPGGGLPSRDARQKKSWPCSVISLSPNVNFTAAKLRRRAFLRSRSKKNWKVHKTRTTSPNSLIKVWVEI